MTKKQAIQIFGKTQVDLAKALGKTKSAIGQWSDELNQDQIRLVLGEAFLQGKPVPKIFKGQRSMINRKKDEERKAALIAEQKRLSSQ
jgi:DNA-binding XRE family transcriptional regulator